MSALSYCTGDMTEAVIKSEISVSFYRNTRLNIQLDNNLHRRFCENLKCPFVLYSLTKFRVEMRAVVIKCHLDCGWLHDEVRWRLVTV